MSERRVRIERITITFKDDKMKTIDWKEPKIQNALEIVHDDMISDENKIIMLEKQDWTLHDILMLIIANEDRRVV